MYACVLYIMVKFFLKLLALCIHKNIAMRCNACVRMVLKKNIYRI